MTFIGLFMICYDLETCLMHRGKKRDDVLIFSIGAVDLLEPERTFHCYVNPLASSKAGLYEDLEAHGAKLAPTKSVLSKIRWRHDKALEPKDALQRFEAFLGDTQLVCAHNGRSFDHKILRAAYRRASMTPDLQYIDSLHDITRKTFKAQRCHKLGVLHAILCQESTLRPRWHEALDDAKALAEIATATAIEIVAQQPRQAWHYASERKDLVAAVNKEHDLKLDTSKRLCGRSIAAWPGVVRCTWSSKSFRQFALNYALHRVWNLYVR